MSAPTSIRSTAGFRSIAIFELTSGLPLGAQVIEPYSPYVVSGSVISGSTVNIAAGTAVSGSVGYYGVVATGAKVLTINDPNPRVIPHIGEDGVMTLQVLPALEPVTGELQMDKTNDVVDAIISNTKKIVVGEMNLFGQSTNKRGFENTVGCLAYTAAQDTDINSTTFGNQTWDFRIMPKVIFFTKDTGYQQEANLRNYTVSPMYCTAHIWGTQFTVAVEGFVRSQLIRGVSEYKPVIVGFIGDGSTVSFPFDSAKPAATVSKISVFKNGAAVTSNMTKSVSGIVFTVAPLVTDIITVMYETV